MTRIYIEEERHREFSCKNDIMLKIHKRVNEEKELVFYFVKFFHNRKTAQEFTLEYINGDLVITKGEVSQKECDILIRCIQILELSGSFPQ